MEPGWELKGVKELAKLCWQRASGQKEDASLLNAFDFAVAGAAAAGVTFKTKHLGDQVEELAAALRVSLYKPVLVAEPAHEPPARAGIVVRTCLFYSCASTCVIFRGNRALV